MYKKPKCFNCGRYGHYSDGCPEKKKQVKCHNCGQLGHYSDKCKEPKMERRDVKCHNCGQLGHYSDKCKEPKMERQDVKCHNCGEFGHKKADCPAVNENHQRPPDPIMDCRKEFLCSVCMDRPCNVLLEPCNHLCVCDQCSNMIDNVCPICRSKVTSKRSIFIA